MHMSKRESVRLKKAILRQIEESWTSDQQNLLLEEFGLRWLDPEWPSFAARLAMVSDDDLVEMYSTVFDVDTSDVPMSTSSQAGGNWKTGYVRLFISHVSEERQFAQEVADELAVVGVHGFVAHETMEIGLPWQRQIESSLQTMDAFLALIHSGFSTRFWCQQEAGWALGRNVPRLALRLGEDPTGFLGSDQWPSRVGRTAKEVAREVSSWIGSIPHLGDTVLEELIRALAEAPNYFDAEAAAKRVAALRTLPDEAFDRIDKVWWSNDQLHGGRLPTRVMQPFYQARGRGWPPPKPPPATAGYEPF